jgi:predicted RNA binding protein YcfA (HicA-like mRNA interferase family)
MYEPSTAFRHPDSNLRTIRAENERFISRIEAKLELLKRDGWYVARMRGSHRQFKHPARAGLVTVAGKPADDLAPGTLNSILKQAALKK